MNIQELIEQYKKEMILLRREFHCCPELSNQEFKTTEKIKKKLLEYGIVIRETGLPTGVIGSIYGDNPGKVLALRADIDALPIEEETGLSFMSIHKGISHACGHDLHITALLFSGRILSLMRNQLHGEIRLIFQPAEENGKGAKSMIEHGAMGVPIPDAVIGLHTWPDIEGGKIGVRKGAASASCDQVTIKVIGVGGHGAHPYRCVDPVVVSAYLLTQLQTLVSRENPAVSPAVLTFGTIHGGTAANVIPAEVVLTGTLRTMSKSSRERITEGIKRITQMCCKAMGANGEVIITEGMPTLINTPAVIDRIVKAAVHVLGEGVVESIENPSLGSDDFSFFLDLAPGALFRIGTGGSNPDSKRGLHNSKNVFDERGIAAGAAVMAQLALEFK